MIVNEIDRERHQNGERLSERVSGTLSKRLVGRLVSRLVGKLFERPGGRVAERVRGGHIYCQRFC